MMCDTCPCSASSIPGPGEVAGALLGVAADSAASKAGRRVLFWGVAVPMLPFAVVGVFGWWTIALVAVAAALTGSGLMFLRVMSRHVVIQAPASLRAALPAPRRAVVLPRNLAITRKRRALPAAETVITGRVVPAPVVRARP